jgi:hypothetical protein
MKELNESASLSAFRNKFETSRSFDLEDDMEFCPGLLTESDVSYPGAAQFARAFAFAFLLTLGSWSPSPAHLSDPH